jgi:hypothetical protein
MAGSMTACGGFLLGGQANRMDKEKHMSHLRNIVGAVEDKGYAVLSIKYDENNRLDIVVENPGYAGNRAFLEKAIEQEGQKNPWKKD